MYKNRFPLASLSIFFLTSCNFIKIQYLQAIWCQMCEKVEKCDPYMTLRKQRLLLQFTKIPKVLLSSQAVRPMYDPQLPPSSRLNKMMSPTIFRCCCGRDQFLPWQNLSDQCCHFLDKFFSSHDGARQKLKICPELFGNKLSESAF